MISVIAALVGMILGSITVTWWVDRKLNKMR